MFYWVDRVRNKQRVKCLSQYHKTVSRVSLKQPLDPKSNTIPTFVVQQCISLDIIHRPNRFNMFLWMIFSRGSKDFYLEEIVSASMIFVDVVLNL